MENNRALILYVYFVLKKYSSADRPLNASEIAAYIKRDYHFAAEPNRKTIYSHLRLLQDLSDLNELQGEIQQHLSGKKKGHYFVRDFTQAEIKLLCDAVASSRFINKTHSKDLIHKLAADYDKDFARRYAPLLEHKASNKSYNPAFFDSIEELSKAIRLKRKITCQYLMYDTNKALVPRYSENNGYITISPYHFIWAINHYYLLCKPDHSEERRFLRVDKIRNVKLLDERSAPLPKNFNIHDYARKQAFMFGGKAEPISFRCQMRMLGQVIDFFGEDVQIKPINDDYFEVSIHTSIDSIKYWVLQYITAIDRIRPEKLKNIIIEYLSDALERNDTAD